MNQQLHFDSSRDLYYKILPEYQQQIENKMAADDLQSYYEILFSHHSCAIGGNSYSVNECRDLYEQRLKYVPQGKTLKESLEMLDQFQAYEIMLDSLQDASLGVLLKKLHFQVKEPCLLEATEKAIQDGLPAMEIAARFHGFFEHLHPFRDGNGRVGRLMSNYILHRCGLPLLIIPIEKREEYIQCLKLFRKDSQEYLIDFFYRTAVEQMESCLSQKKAASKKMFFMF